MNRWVKSEGGREGGRGSGRETCSVSERCIAPRAMAAFRRCVCVCVCVCARARGVHKDVGAGCSVRVYVYAHKDVGAGCSVCALLHGWCWWPGGPSEAPALPVREQHSHAPGAAAHVVGCETCIGAIGLGAPQAGLRGPAW